MSIIAYTGLPGSGKSYNSVANVIVPALEKGRRVVTNIPINVGVLNAEGHTDRLTQFDSSDYTSDTFIADWVTPNHGAVFVLDEVWRLWPSGLQQSKMPKDQQQWLAEHRHHTGTDGYTDEIVLVTQRLGQIAAPVRQLVESQYQHVKLTAAGSSKSFTVKVFAGGDANPREADMVNQLHGRYKPTIFRWYQSHTQAQTDTALESKADKRANIFRSPKFIAAAAFSVVGVFGGIYMAGASINGLAESEAEAVNQVAAVPVVPRVERSEARARPDTAGPPIPPEPSGPVLSERWRIGGWIKSGDKKIVLLASWDGATRRVSDGCDLTLDEPECLLDGERITEYSGRRPRQDRGYLANAAGQWSGHVQGVK